MTKYVALIVATKYEFQASINTEEDFTELTQGSRDVKWAKLFERESGRLVASYSEETRRFTRVNSYNENTEES